MGRLPAVVAAGACVLVLGACDESSDAPSAPKARSQAVLGSAAPETKNAPAPKPASTGAAKAAPKKLCGGKLDTPGKPFPAALSIDRAAAEGEAEPGASVAIGDGKWTWVNFWAAWCKPCKEEMPMLKSWEKKLGDDGVKARVVFVSIDDDERQLKRFLGEKAAPIRATHWLREGDQRSKWLTSAGMTDDPQLPAHLIVDPAGKVRCSFEGAIEEADYARVLSLLKG